MNQYNFILFLVAGTCVIDSSLGGERWKGWDDHVNARLKRQTQMNWQDVATFPTCTLTDITTNDELGRRASKKLLPAGSQGNCGSCWAFAITHTFADHLRIASDMNSNMAFSQDHLAKCNKEANDGNGCCGSDFESAFEFLQSTGFATLACLPYNLEDYPPDVIDGMARTAATTDSATRDYKQANPLTCPAECRDNSNIALRRLPGFRFLLSENRVMEAIRLGPVIAAVRVRSSSAINLLNYRCGIYEGNPVSITTLPANHAIEIVDFSRASYTGVPYWVVKNTWGTDWGEDGYFRVARDRTQFSDFYALDIDSSSSSAQNSPTNSQPASLCGSQRVANVSDNMLVQSAAEFGLSTLTNMSLIVCTGGDGRAAQLKLVSIINATQQVIEGFMLEVTVEARATCSSSGTHRAIITLTVMMEMDNSFSLVEYHYDFQSNNSAVQEGWSYLLVLVLAAIQVMLC